MNFILFDDPLIRTALLPLTFTRPVGEIRVGILTIREKWENRLNGKAFFKTAPYLQEKYPYVEAGLWINGAICPDDKLIDAVRALPQPYFLVQDELLIASHGMPEAFNEKTVIPYPHPLTVIRKPWHIFQQNAAQIKQDFEDVRKGRTSAEITDSHTVVYNRDNIFLEEGVYLRAAILNAEPGPIYLGKNSVVQEGAIIRGSFALGEGGHINMGAKIRGDTSIGPFSKVGGEVSNTVVIGNSNKAHDGYLGNSVIGEWCNLGADSNTSNLKNNYDITSMWNHETSTYESTGLQFCGLIMGDHSKCSINTMFNTATMVDVCANIFGEGFPPSHVPSFAWGGAGGFVTYDLEKCLETVERVFKRRNVSFSEIERNILIHIFASTAPHRHWEKQ